MKRLFAGLAVAVGLLTAAPAFADYYVRTGPMVVRPMVMAPRDPLSGTTMMRVHNDSHYTIIRIRSSNAQFGTTYRWGSPLSWAGGSIPPHYTQTVDFGDHTSACIFYVEITTADGHVHVYGNVNTCRTNDILVPDTGW